MNGVTRARLRFLGPAAAGAAFLHSLLIGWGRWGDPFVDTGRELLLPARLLAGETLYADLRWYYGPLAPWVNAGLYALFGVRVGVLQAAGIVTAALAAVVLYRLGDRLAGPAGATSATVAFAYLCAFPHLGTAGIFNWALPYTFAATYGMLAAMGSLLFLLRHAERGASADLAASTGLLALAALSKVETLVPAAAAHGLFLLLAARSRTLRRAHLAAYAGAGALVLGVYAGLYVRMGPSLWTDNLAGVVNGRARSFILGVMGLSEPADGLLRMGLSLLLLGGTAGLAGLAGRVAAGGRTALGGIVAVIAFAAVCATYLQLGQLTFAAMPVLLAAALAAAGVGLARERAPADPAAALAAAFALGAMLRIVLRPLADHYAFYLMPVPMACLAGWLFRTLPDRLGPRYARGAVALVASGLFLGVSAGVLRVSLQAYAEKTAVLASPTRGSMGIPRTWASLERLVRDLAAYPPATRLLVLPQGETLTFFSGLAPADRQSSHLPMEFADPAQDRDLAARWRRRPPDLVVWTDQEMPEFGSRGFGIDYAPESARFIVDHYELVATYPPAIFLLARIDPAAPRARPPRRLGLVVPGT